MFCSHSGSAARATAIAAMKALRKHRTFSPFRAHPLRPFAISGGMTEFAATKDGAPRPGSSEVFIRALRENFNLHLLRADVVSNVLCSNGQAVGSGSKFTWHHQFASAG